MLHSKIIVSKTERNPTSDGIICFACWEGNACLEARNNRIWRKSPMELETNLGKDWHDKKVKIICKRFVSRRMQNIQGLKSTVFFLMVGIWTAGSGHRLVVTTANGRSTDSQGYKGAVSSVYFRDKVELGGKWPRSTVSRNFELAELK